MKWAEGEWWRWSQMTTRNLGVSDRAGCCYQELWGKRLLRLSKQMAVRQSKSELAKSRPKNENKAES